MDNTNESRRRGWTLAIVSLGLFMVVLDNLVVSVALPSIHRDFGASGIQAEHRSPISLDKLLVAAKLLVVSAH